jgi:anti-sigma factor RsiW
MSERERHYENIERYLRGELSDAERRAFEAAMAQEEALQKEVALHRELEDTFGDPEYQQLLGVLKEVDAGTASPAEKGKKVRLLRSRRWWMGIAATLLLLVAVTAVLLLRSDRTPSTDELFAQHFSPYPVDAFRTGEGQPPEALRAYQAGRYAEAARLIEALPADSVTTLMTFYRGVALLADGQPTEAAPVFEKLLEENALPILVQPSQWYLALAYLEEGAVEKARQRLEGIAEDEHHYRREEAMELLGKLR